MAIALVQSNSPNLANSPRFAAPPTPGSLLIVQHASGVLQAGGGPGSDWVDLIGDYLTIAPGNLGFAMWGRIARAGDPAILPGAWGADFWDAGEWSSTAPWSVVPVTGGVASTENNAPPAVARYHKAFTPTFAGEILIIGAGLTGVGAVAGVAADAGYTVIGKHDYGGAGKVAAMVGLVDPINDAAYDPGWTSGAAPNNWCAAALAFAGTPLGGAGIPRRFW